MSCGNKACGLRLGGKSRMTRERPVRICEGGEVGFLSATRLVILCRKGKADEALQRLREIMGKLKLTVNDEKTRICKVPEEEFDFLNTFAQTCTPGSRTPLPAPCRCVSSRR